MKTKNGGAAFPFKYKVPAGSPLKIDGVDCGVSKEAQAYVDCGMSLRDWFAGKALEGAAANPVCGAHAAGFDCAKSAEACYKMADAMIAEREK